MGAYGRQVRMVAGVVVANPALRRVQLAFAGFNSAEWGTWIAMLVFAYGHGGATASGLVATGMLVPATLFAPYAGALGDRHPRGRVLLWGYAGQAATMGLTAVALLAGAPPLVCYLLGSGAATAITVTRPTQGALLPELASTPEQLTAANVVAGWIESVSVLAAPALTGVLLALSGPGEVFALMAAVALAAAVAVAALGEAGAAAASTVSPDEGSLRTGMATLRAEPAARLLVALLAAQYVALGALDVLYVVLALDTLGLGQSWAGYLNAAFGAGGTLGVAATVALVGRRRLLRPLVAGIAVWALALAVLGAWPRPASALVLLAAAGVARSLVDVAGRTLLQRAAAPEVLARVFGMLEALSSAALAVGSMLAPVLVAFGGAPLALAGLAAVLPLVALAAFRGLRRIDRTATVPAVELALLRRMRIFAGLAAPVLEGLARSLEPRTVADGEVLIRQGDPGDRFYAVADGELEVTVDGRFVRRLERGDGAGEIALLRDVPRTATVTARSPAHVYALEKMPFVAAVTGHAPAERLVVERLGDARPRLSIEEV